MKHLLIGLVLMMMPVVADSMVYEEHRQNLFGDTMIRFHNATPNPVSCWYRSSGTFVTFVLYPWTRSYWYPLIGYYEWRCK